MSNQIAPKRPLSPHLQVYRLPLTALMSITHRLTGAALALGMLIVAGFFLAAATSEEYYDMLMRAADTVGGKAILCLWSAALYYHMCNGIRHMFWDTGMFLEKDQANRTNYAVLMVAFMLVAGTWVYAYYVN
ncbi:MAG: succinate dehydrogenase, cytochrome b556 subunit [Alphaproteobacteria bacterium]|nr:succinate dehydrogenase, cytochrome b556 subunit [Alphaproteobacteria bacterium]